MIQKEKYLAPQIEIIKMENEGVIATSGNLPSVGMVEMHTVVVLVPQEVIMALAVVIWKT